MKKRELTFIIITLLLTSSCFQGIYRRELKRSETVIQKGTLSNSSDDNIPSFAWKKNWAGPIWDMGIKMAIDSSDNIHITGYSEVLNDDENFLYLKYDKDGALLNSMTWDRNNEANLGRDIVLDSANNFYIAGYTDVNPDVWVEDYNTYVSKFSSAGVSQWEHIWGGNEIDIARSIVLDSFGNVYLGGLTWSYGAGQSDILLLKYTNAGTFQWNKTYGDIESEWINSMVIDSSNNIYLAGGCQYNETSDYNTYLIKVDNNGIEQWNRVWGGAGDEYGASIALDSSENVYIGGYTSSFGAGNTDAFILKFDGYGNLIWNITYGTDNYEDGWPITIDWQDNIYIGGEFYDVQTYEDSIFLAKFTQTGNQLWNMTYDISESIEYLYDIKISSSDDIYLTGGEYFSGTTYMDVYLMKFNYDLSEFVLISPEEKVYTEPMSGYFPAVYGFENDKRGTVPIEWENYTFGDTKVEVEPEFNGHKNIIKAHFSESGGAWNLLNYFNKTEGTIEFWMASSSNSSTSETIMRTQNGTYSAWEIGFRGGDIRILIPVGGGSFYFLKIGTYQINTWYYIRIDFRSNSGKSYLGLNQNEYRIYINGEDKGTYEFMWPQNPDRVHLIGTGSGNDFYSYFDAFGYSWEPQYNIGDNFNEGLLLDFKTRNSLEWKAYSLDSQNNVSIRGNTVIPFPEDGPHIIQLFANNSLGNIFETEKVHFIIDTKTPEIMIFSPIENKVYGDLAPKYNLSFNEENLISAWYTIDGGKTNFSITKLNDYIDQDSWLGTLDGPITVEFYAEDIVGRIGYKNITIIKDVVNPLTIEIVDFTFSIEMFNLTFFIYNETNEGIDFAELQIWWDGTEVSNNVQNLGNGFYFISLDPITVVQGQDPIILQIVAYAHDYDGKYFETAISVDPDSLQKNGGEEQQRNRIPVEIIVISASLSLAAVLGAVVYIMIRRRKKLTNISR